ncbi:hypothetical protein [Marinobacterium aestuariivivens]|uniref:Uncharacterized protein n=1 Tax=Marinobacterium aestuariivivens TaxID=1698799 RepID=A0ABW2A4C2_9GAMM
MLETRTGKRLSVESTQAAELYQQAVDSILGSESGAAQALDRALELEAEFALAAAARYCVAKDVGEPGAEAYRALAERASPGASNWEREQVDVLEHIERVWGMMGHPFVALHVAGLYASAGDLGGLERCEYTISGKAAGVNRDVSLALVSALSDFVTGDYPRAAQTLATLSPGARIGIGGSNVERILVDLLESRCLARQ